MLRRIRLDEVDRWGRRDACAPKGGMVAVWIEGGKPLDGVCFGVENPSYESSRWDACDPGGGDGVDAETSSA
jgi:hypothetical protein